MSGRLRAASGAVAACFYCFGSPLVGQTTGTLDLGASIVEYDGFLASGAAMVGSALRWDAPNHSLAAQGNWTIFESGNQNVQATAAGAWLTPRGEWWRLELSGAAGASKYASHAASGHVLGRPRVHLFAERMGGWFGVTAGGSFGESDDSSLEFAIGAWRVWHSFAVVGNLTTTQVGADRFTDMVGAARWTRAPVEIEARAGVRPWVHSRDEVAKPVTSVYGDVSALLWLGERISLALNGGSYPADPVRRVLAAKYLTVGVHLTVWGTEASPTAMITRVTAAPIRDDVVVGNASRARIEITPAAELHAIRIHLLGAESVELMGDFTDWQPVPLTQIRPGTWQIQLALAPGVHRVNVRIDGGAWLVPAGARPEESDFGGAVGLIVVR